MNFLDYLIPGLAGFAYGAFMGVIKYILLWRPIITGQRKLDAVSITATQFSSLAANLLILLVIFFLRNLWPYSFTVTVVAAAVSLSLVGRYVSWWEVRKLDISGKINEDHKEPIMEASIKPPQD